MNQNACGCTPVNPSGEEKMVGVQDILSGAQNQLNECESLVNHLLTFITGEEDKGANARSTDCMVSQAVNIRDQAENVREGLCRVFDALGVK